MGNPSHMDALSLLFPHDIKSEPPGKRRVLPWTFSILFPKSDAQAVAQKYVIPVNYLLLAIVWLSCFRSCVFVGCFFQHGISKKKMKNDEFPSWDTIWFLESV